MYGPDTGPDIDPVATPLVMVHGFRGDHHGLEPVVARLPGFRVIVPDLPGFGECPPLASGVHDLAGYANWATAFVRGVAPGGAALLGHSFGSIVATAAVAGGLEVSSLALVSPIAGSALGGPHPVLTAATVALHRFAGALPERVGTALLRSRVFSRGAGLTMLRTRDREIRRFVHAQHDRWFGGFHDRRTLLEAFAASVAHGVDEFAPHVTVPTLLVVSELDDVCSREQQRRLATAFPDARLEWLPGTGHLSHYEQPAAIAALVAEFLRRG